MGYLNLANRNSPKLEHIICLIGTVVVIVLRWCTHKRKHTHTHTHTNICTHANTHTLMCNHARTHSRTRTHTHTHLSERRRSGYAGIGTVVVIVLLGRSCLGYPFRSDGLIGFLALLRSRAPLASLQPWPATQSAPHQAGKERIGRAESVPRRRF